MPPSSLNRMGIQVPSGKLLSVFAFEVAPKQKDHFTGGAIDVDVDLQTALDAAFDVSKIDDAPAVNFEVDTTDSKRAHPVRDAALLIGFAQSAQALQAAESLAQRLANSMDMRSKPTLLMVSTHQPPHGSASKRRLLIWTFPQQEVFRLNKKQGQANLDLLEVFIKESKLRKAAMLEGGNTRVDMLQAQVLDFQASASDRAAADLWIVKFLQARSQMGSEEGTRILAKALKNTHSKFIDDADAQAQINAAITGLRNSQKSRWSINDVSKAFFTGDVSSDFTSRLKDSERLAVFAVDHEIFDRLVKYRVYTLDNGVLVSAPFSEVGNNSQDGGSVQITEDNGERFLQASGKIEEEKVRTRG